ncbi:MAG: hypothetical protein ACT4OU_10205 [Hyphomicrobium sp.]
MGAIKLTRYTNLASTIDILRNQRLTLLSPETWNDRNDSSYIAEFKRQKKLQSVLAVCFAESAETYHHWGVFAPGCDGVCIEFEMELIKRAVGKHKEFEARHVNYSTIADVERDPPKDDNLPFLKRWPYEPEGEFRIIFKSKNVKFDTKFLPISAQCIRHVTLSPWMPNGIVDAVRDTLKSINGCKDIPMHRSGLVDNERWRKAVEPEMHATPEP